MRGYSNRFDLSPPCTHASDARDERNLQRADYLVAVDNHHQSLIRISFYGVESVDVSLVEGCTRYFSLAPEFVIGQ